MSVKTIPFREIEKRTPDIFEATVVVGKRAKQIIAERKAEIELEDLESEPGLLDEIPDRAEEYEEKEKATTIAIREFLNGDIEWNYTEKEEKDTTLSE